MPVLSWDAMIVKMGISSDGWQAMGKRMQMILPVLSWDTVIAKMGILSDGWQVMGKKMQMILYTKVMEMNNGFSSS
jgi:hypothetical protein